jgi:hypothetical protein
VRHILQLLLVVCVIPLSAQSSRDRITATLQKTIADQAQGALRELPQTITSVSCERSVGGKHDYYSEGDYWWPDPANPDGPYVQRDGESNPNNFNAHRELLIRFSRIMGALGSAYVQRRDERYVIAALRHAKAWFIDADTKMNPSLLYAQAIKGRVTGRGIGIIDTIHLMEVVQTLMVMDRDDAINAGAMSKIKKWFSLYLEWLTTHEYGKEEINAKNNHGTCWVMQVACFARFVGNNALMDQCREHFKHVLLPRQMEQNGSFPLELARTKPYGYSIFNLDAIAIICQILSTSTGNLWEFAVGGRTMKKGIEFLYPYIRSKKSWPYRKDIMYWEHLPVAQPFLLFGALAFEESAWFETWERLDHDPQNKEVLRNLPVRNPLLWIRQSD